MPKTDAIRPAAPAEPMPAWARALVEGQDRLRAEVAALRDQLAPRRAAGDADADVTVAHALAEMGLGFLSCREVMALAATSLPLRQALTAALIDDASQLGHCLARLRKRGLIDREAKRSPHGWRWRA